MSHELQHDNGPWPRLCLCNDCLHVKLFDTFDECFASNCERCGEPSDGNGYCWCESCSLEAGTIYAIELVNSGDPF